jgi:hypothetical protein
MEGGERDEIVSTLQSKLHECEARFDTEARKRGFDPAQAANMALPSMLARLFTECDAIRTELEEITGNRDGRSEGGIGHHGE